MVTQTDTYGRPVALQVDGHTVEFSRLDAYDLVLAYCYQGGEVCALNAAGLCPHCVEALFEAAQQHGVTVTTFKYQANAEQFAEWMNAKVYGLRSAQTPHGEGQRWVVAK